MPAFFMLARLMPMQLNCKNKILDLSCPRVMGVLNVTPDSFSDGGQHVEIEHAVRRAMQMIDEGAVIIDVGGESTRPGAQPVNEQQELDRVLPVIERLSAETEVLISIDTMKPVVMREAVKAGAHIVNDVNALQADNAEVVVAESGAAVCLMHMQGLPRTMQSDPHYEEVVAEVSAFLMQRAQRCIESGIASDQIMIDPGFGFGKTLTHNLQLMAGIARLCESGWPVLVGVSRKSMLGALLDVPPAERVHGGVAAAVLACWQGVKLIRTHDVRATVEALRVVQAIQEQNS